MEIIDPLNKRLRALRTLQCPQHIQPNGTAYRVSSAAFIAGSDGTISVDLEESLLRMRLPVTARYPGLDRAVGLVGHMIETYETNGFTVEHDPINNNPHHGTIRTAFKNNAARRAARALADEVQFIVPIDQVAAVALGALPLKS